MGRDRSPLGQFLTHYPVFLRHYRHAGAVREQLVIVLPRILVDAQCARVEGFAGSEHNNGHSSTERESDYNAFHGVSEPVSATSARLFPQIPVNPDPFGSETARIAGSLSRNRRWGPAARTQAILHSPA
jgi:hypothetical protein